MEVFEVISQGVNAITLREFTLFCATIAKRLIERVGGQVQRTKIGFTLGKQFYFEKYYLNCVTFIRLMTTAT